jgi:hypothetical protein
LFDYFCFRRQQSRTGMLSFDICRQGVIIGLQCPSGCICASLITMPANRIPLLALVFFSFPRRVHFGITTFSQPYEGWGSYKK